MDRTREDLIACCASGVLAQLTIGRRIDEVLRDIDDQRPATAEARLRILLSAGWFDILEQYAGVGYHLFREALVAYTDPCAEKQRAASVRASTLLALIRSSESPWQNDPTT